MKKTTLSMVSILALSGLGFAGGDIAPVETIIETQMVMEQNPFYIGLGIGYAQLNDDFTNEEISSNNIMLQGGYSFSNRWY